MAHVENQKVDKRVVVIGGGPGGYVAAIRAAQLGATVTVVEKQKVGGTCLNVGCIPTKALLACSEAYHTIKNAASFGIEITGEVKVNFPKIMERKDKIVAQLNKGIEFLFNKNGIRLVDGLGSVPQPGLVKVTKNDGSVEEIETDVIIIATGSVPVKIPVFPFDGETVITSDEALSLKELPKSMLIVGAGVIGVEFGTFYRTLGTEVTIVEMMEHALPPEDADTGKLLERALKKEKIKLLTNTKIEETKIVDGKVQARLSTGEVLEAEKMLVAIGRAPNTKGLGAEEIGLKMERGAIVVNEYMETSIPGTYAIGDVNGGILLAHVASYEGILAVENALLGTARKADYTVVPRCVFTDPEVGGAGLTEKEAKAKGIDYKVATFPFRGLGKAQAIGKFEGHVKLIVDPATDKLLGAAIVGAHATDLIAELALAIQTGITVEEVGNTIHAHPTLAEAMMEAAHVAHDKGIHTV